MSVLKLDAMTIAHGRRVGLDHAKKAMIQRLEKAKLRIAQLQ
jgi:hypothetical protein